MPSDDVIDLISDSDSEQRPARRPLKRRRVVPPPPLQPTGSSSSDLEIVSHTVRGTTEQDLSQAPAPAPAPVRSAARGGSGPDADVAVVGARTQLQALVDYPHFRFQCVVEPFKRQRASKKEKFCPRCFCYVCDIPAADCRRWKLHSKAVDSALRWRNEREANLEARRQRHAAQPAARRTLPARHVRPAPIMEPIQDELSLGSSVEEVAMGDAPAYGTEDERPPQQHIAFEDARRALEAFELNPNPFGIRPLMCALDDAATTSRPVPIGATLRSRNRRLVP